jgi:hypothetical protein
MQATQTLNSGQQQVNTMRAEPVFISREALLYVALALLSLVLRVAQLDAVPLSTVEARQALAAWRVVYPLAAGTPIVANSPLLFTLHSLMFTVLGSSEFSARILTALAGIGLIFTPLLFRGLLGRTRTLLLSVIFTFSPILLVTSRSDSPVVWAMLAVAFSLWGLWRYRESREPHFALITMVSVTTMIFLTDPTGLFLALILIGAVLFTVWSGRWAVGEEGEEDAALPGADDIRSAIRAWPWVTGLVLSIGVAFLLSTQLLTYAAGLSMVGELLHAGLSGLATSRPFIPGAFPLLITLFYEPVMVILAIGRVLGLMRGGRYSALERFFTGWAIFAAVFGLTYAGAGPEHALYLIVPLACLVSGLAVDLFTRATDTVWWTAPTWGKWLVMLIVVGLLSMFAIHVQTLSRTMMLSVDAPIQLGSSNSISMVWVIIIVLFMIIGFFLASSIWGAGTTIQGGLMGLLAFTLVTSLGSGWRAAVFSAGDPVEFWNRNPTHPSVFLLRQTLNDLAKRESSGFPLIPVSVLAPDDGVVAWLLRDYPKTQFFPDASAASGQPIVLLPSAIDKPDLGGAYVGAQFAITSVWDYDTVRLVDFPAWWLQRKTRTGALPADQVTLWLRQDIYNGVPFQAGQ